MKRSIVTVAACLALASLGGCAANGIAPAAPAAAADAGIIVTGEGEARATPDIATLRLGIEAHRPSMAEARTASAAAQARILESLKSFGVVAADIQTEQLSLAPQYDYGEKGRTLRGYVATNMVRVKLRDISKVGAIVDAAAAAGDDDTRVDGLSFELADTATVRAEARRLAVADAKKKAEQLAAELGAKIGEPIAIEEVAVHAPGPVMMRDMAMMKGGAESTPVEAGSVEARVTVRVRWALDEA